MRSGFEVFFIWFSLIFIASCGGNSPGGLEKPVEAAGASNTDLPEMGLSRRETRGFVYYLYVPSSYDPSKKYPFILALHWSTGRGTDMIDRWQTQAEKKGYILACPNAKDSKDWDPSEDKDVFRMIGEIKQEYNIDDFRMFVTGFSYGAKFTYYLGLNYPEKFKAMAPFAGPLKELGDKVRLSSDPKKHIPVFIIHGDDDNVIDVGESRWAKEQLEKHGYSVKYRGIRGLNHVYPKDTISWAIMNWFERIK